MDILNCSPTLLFTKHQELPNQSSAEISVVAGCERLDCAKRRGHISEDREL